MRKIELIGVQHKSIVVEGGVVKIVKKRSIVNTAREKAIPISNISGVDVKKPGIMSRGYIQIQTAGQMSGNSTYKVTGGAFDAAQDENSVLFDKKDYQTALEIQEYILNYTSNPQGIPQSSAADELLKLKQLLDSGALTEQEFQEQKTKLLAN